MLSLTINQPHLAVIKGEGGEIERNPDMECLVQSVHNGELSNETWPPLFKKRHVKEEVLEPQGLLTVFCFEIEDEFAEAAVVGTAAIALKLMGKAVSIDEAQEHKG